ncbi:MAG: alpha-2-macroglobulin family protein [Saprospiraceae bacterium]
MILYRLTFFIIILGFSEVLLFGQYSTRFNLNFKSPSWYQYDSLIREKHFSKAESKIESILDESIKSNICPEIIRSIEVLGAIKSRNNKYKYISLIQTIEGNLNRLHGPCLAIAQSILAELYANIQNSSSCHTEGFSNDSTGLLNWPVSRIMDISSQYYLSSISNIETQEIKIGTLRSAFELGGDTILRPSVYDFLFYRALSFFTSTQSEFLEPEVNDDKFMSGIDEFLNTDFSDNIIYELYQRIMRLNLERNNLDGLIDANIYRLKYALRQNDDKIHYTKYYNLLVELYNKYKETTAAGNILFELGDMFSESSYSRLNNFQKSNIKADSIFNLILNKHPNCLSRNLTLFALDRIHAKNFDFKIEKINTSNRNFKILLSYKNIQSIQLNIYKLTQSKYERIPDDGWQNELVSCCLDSSIRSWIDTLPLPNDFKTHSIELKIDSLPIGFYYIKLSSATDSIDLYLEYGNKFQISNMAVVNFTNDGESKKLIAIDRETGKQLGNVLFEFHTLLDYCNPRIANCLVIDTMQSNENGMCNVPIIDKRRISKVYAYCGNDVSINNRSIYNRKNSISEADDRVLIFTDRQIYRPGQTIFFKIITIRYDTFGIPSIVKNRPIEVSLASGYQYNVQVLKLTTDEMGSAHGTFKIPLNSWIGEFALDAENDDDVLDSLEELSSYDIDEEDDYSFEGRNNIQIEEYRKPGIEILFDSHQETLLFGKNIVISGTIQTYNGIPFANANIECIIFSNSTWNGNASNHSNFLRYNNEDWNSHNLKTDSKGRFLINFFPINEVSIANQLIIRPYLINLNVKNLNGESESKTIELKIANKREIISSDLKAFYNSNEQINITYTSKNIYDALVESSKTITILQQSIPQNNLRNRLWQKPEFQQYNLIEYSKYFPDDVYLEENKKENWKTINKIYYKEYKQNSSCILKLSKICKPGAYKIIVETFHEGQQTEITEEYYIVYNNQENSYFEPTLVNHSLDIKPTESVQLTLMKTKRPYLIYYMFESRIKILEGIMHSDSFKNYTFNINEMDRGGAYFTGICFYQNRNYTFEYNYPIPWSNKEMKLKPINFKNKITPGGKENWKFNIEPKINQTSSIEILASMYDASLDHISAFQWDKEIWLKYQKKYSFTTEGFEITGSKYISGYYSNRHIPYSPYTRIINFYHSVPNCSIEDCIYEVDKSISSFMLEETSEIKLSTNIRQNLNETAFFLPNINLKRNNNFNIDFKTPESYTRWKTQIFAYDKDLNYAYTELNSTTSKHLEIKPFYPRALREGDNIKIQASLTNNTNHNDNGIVRLELVSKLNLEPEKKLPLVDQNIKFSIDAHETKIYNWSIVVPKVKNSKLLFRFVATGRKNKDGEEKEITILSNQKEIIESFPLHMAPNKNKDFEFSSMKKIVNDSHTTPLKYKFEYTLNPILYVLECIPYLIYNSNESSDLMVNSFFGYALVDKIVREYPQYKKMLEYSYYQNMPKSALNKNEDVKNINLSETPWERNAQSEKIENVNEFFPLDSIFAQNNLNIFLNKILRYEANDNGISWFPGMASSRWLSQHIINEISKLEKLNKNMNNYLKYNSSFNKLKLFLADQLKKDYLYIQSIGEKDSNYLEANHLTEEHLLFLYGKTMYSTNNKDSLLECAENYFLQQAVKFDGVENLYSGGLRALILDRNGYHTEAKKILELIKEEAIETKEFGTYWNILHNASLNSNAIEIQSILIEAFAEIDSSTIVSHMIDWLIKNKQTNNWGSGNATVNAIYCLLKYGCNSEKNLTLPSMIIGANKIQFENLESEPPYISRIWENSKIDSSLANIKILNAPNSNSWGAAYFVYSKDINEVKNSSETNLKLEKLFFHKKKINNKEELILIKSNDTIKLGDNIITQLKISVDRPMDFVQMKVMHCAGFESTNQLSGVQWTNGITYYVAPKDTETDFFFDKIKPGTYSINIEFNASFEGTFTDGIGFIQSMYAPEFSAHSYCRKIVIK